MITIISVVSLVVLFGAAYWLVGWLLAFLVVSQEALISFAVIVMLGFGALALFGSAARRNRWWSIAIIALLACVALEFLEPYVGVIRIVLAAIVAIWAVVTLQPTFRRIARSIHNGQQTNP